MGAGCMGCAARTVGDVAARAVVWCVVAQCRAVYGAALALAMVVGVSSDLARRMRAA